MSQPENEAAQISFRLRDKALFPLGPWARDRLLIDVQMNRPARATIFHNPSCGTSRKTLDILREEGLDIEVREYLKHPPTRDELKALYQRAGISPREGLRAKEPLAAELGLTGEGVDDEKILDAMVEHPILINRPLVETDKGARLCRPQEKVREIL